MRGLTQKDLEVLEFIKAFMKENNVSPTIKEITDFFGHASTTGVYEHIERLIDAGEIIRYKDRSSRYIVKGMEYREVEK